MANHSREEIDIINAFTNNTFSLGLTENSIKTTVESSFNYLLDLQKAYIDIKRFHYTADDFFVNDDGHRALTIPYNLIELAKRKEYRLSKLYNNYIELDELLEDPNMFTFIPLIIIDDHVVFDFRVRSSIEEKTDIVFADGALGIDFLTRDHVCNVVLLKDPKIYQFVTNKNVIENYNWKIPSSITNIEDRLGPVLFSLRAKPYVDRSGLVPSLVYPKTTNLFIGYLTEDGLSIDSNDTNIRTYIESYGDIEFMVFSMNDFYEVQDMVPIGTRIDTSVNTAVFTIAENGTDAYKMPIPPDNVIVIRHNKNTNEYLFLPNVDLRLHYPNIYEVSSQYLNKTVYEYKIFYFYKPLQQYLSYVNHMNAIYRFFTRKLNLDYTKTVQKLLFEPYQDEYIQNFFFSMMNYADYVYQYNFGDFFNTSAPYDFNYKIDKMREFIIKEPMILKYYGEKISAPTENYYLDVRTINLSKRYRVNNFAEVENPMDREVFDEPCYIFAFRNEANVKLEVRFFVDGLLVPDFYSLHTNGMEYFYIPISKVEAESYIEIEKFNVYTFTERIRFNSLADEKVIKFTSKEFIKPTLFDLFVLDDNFERVNRENFSIYALIDNGEYDISDYINKGTVDGYLLLNNLVQQDPETGETWIIITEDLIDNIGILFGDDAQWSSDNDRIPLKYLFLNKIKVRPINDTVVNKDLSFVIRKIPYITSAFMYQGGLPKMKLFNGNVSWREDTSYIRTFINGRFMNFNYEISKDGPMDTYLIPHCYIDEGDTLTCDISPFSYELEFELEQIPENFIVSFKGKLTKPFSFKYYDIYLNGKKLNPHNIEILTADKIKIFNVNAIWNLLVYRKDHDFEYFGFTSESHMILDDILSDTSYFTEDDKEDIINDIIHIDVDRDPDEIIEPGENEEPPEEEPHDMDDDEYQMHRFYLDQITVRDIARPNTLFFDVDLLTSMYSYVWGTYGNNTDRIVLRPNIHGSTAKHILVLGKNAMVNYTGGDDETVRILLEEAYNRLGDPTVFTEHGWDGTAIGSVCSLINQIAWLKFVADSLNALHVYKNNITPEEFDALLNGSIDFMGDPETIAKYSRDGSSIGAFASLYSRLDWLRFILDIVRKLHPTQVKPDE